MEGNAPLTTNKNGKNNKRGLSIDSSSSLPERQNKRRK